MAMKDICKTLIQTMDLSSVSDFIVSVEEIFTITKEEELQKAEKLHMNFLTKRCA